MQLIHIGRRQPLPELVEALDQLLIWHREYSADAGGERTGRVWPEGGDGPRDERVVFRDQRDVRREDRAGRRDEGGEGTRRRLVRLERAHGEIGGAQIPLVLGLRQIAGHAQSTIDPPRLG